MVPQPSLRLEIGAEMLQLACAACRERGLIVNLALLVVQSGLPGFGIPELRQLAIKFGYILKPLEVGCERMKRRELTSGVAALFSLNSIGFSGLEQLVDKSGIDFLRSGLHSLHFQPLNSVCDDLRWRPLVWSGIDLDLVRRACLVFLSAQGDNLRIVEVQVANGHVVQKPVVHRLFLALRTRIGCAMSDHPGHGAGVAVEGKSSGHARASGESGGINAVLINGEAAMRVVPHGLGCGHLRRAWPVFGIVGAGDGVPVFFRGRLVNLDRNFSTRAGIESVDHRPATVRRILRREIESVGLSEIFESDKLSDCAAGGLRVECVRLVLRGVGRCKQNDGECNAQKILLVQLNTWIPLSTSSILSRELMPKEQTESPS